VGVHYPLGGFKQIAQSLRVAAEELGVDFRFNSKVQQVVVGKSPTSSLHSVTRLSPTWPPIGENSRAEGVLVEAPGGESRFLAADVVVTNVDVPFTNAHLLPPPHAVVDPAQRVSSAVVEFCWSLNRRFEGLNHHTIFLKETPIHRAWESVFKHNVFDPEHFNFYGACQQGTTT
jgi:phytoene dehydrogenase-like protein